MSAPNVLLIMTDEERYPPPYETATVAEFRRTQLTARDRIRDGGLELHRHYVGSTACVPSRATLFTGQYPSLHGVSQTDGVAKHNDDPGMAWLDPDQVPTLGDWFRAGGYQTHYRGKWHINHADLPVPGSHEGLMASDADGRVIREAVEAYRRADRLDPFGFSGWIGREPHGAAKPDIAAAPSQADSFLGRPACQEQFKGLWPQMVANQPTDNAYRRLYYYLHKLVDQAIGRILDALDASGMADDTIIVFTSDHGDLLGAHGGLQQKWANAFDEATRVPMVIKGPGIDPVAGGITAPTSHVDLIPTLLGLAGIDIERASAGVAERHAEARPLPGRDLSRVVTGKVAPETIAGAIYFMTEDNVTSGQAQANVLTGEPFGCLDAPFCIESVVASLPTGDDGAQELWKLNHYYERLDQWNAERGIPTTPGAQPAAEPAWELHNLTVDPEERNNLSTDSHVTLSEMRTVLEERATRSDCCRQSVLPQPELAGTATIALMRSWNGSDSSTPAIVRTARPKRLGEEHTTEVGVRALQGARTRSSPRCGCGSGSGHSERR